MKLLEQSTGLGKQPLAELIQIRVKDYMVVASKQEVAGRPAEALPLLRGTQNADAFAAPSYNPAGAIVSNGIEGTIGPY